MSLQFSIPLRNGRANQLFAVIGPNPKLQIFTGPTEADCIAPDSGTKLLDTALPPNWMADAEEGVAVKSGVWTGSALAGGLAGHFRIKDINDFCHMQGNITVAGDGGAMILDNVNLVLGEVVTISRFAVTDGNA